MKNFENLVYLKKRLTLDISLCKGFCFLVVFLIALICVIKLLIFSISCVSSSLSIISIYFDNKILFENLSFSLPPGAIMGIVGPNGAGKTTLFKMLVKQLQPDEGTLTFGSTVKIGYVDQERSSMQHEKKTVWEAISNGLDIIKVGKFEIPSRSYIGRFNFRGSDQQKFVNNLSGGERGRLHLAASLINGSNVLLLDEPSNDLDVETLRALEDAILEFAGSVIVISHDRWFLDRICTHILAFEGDSKVIFFEGNYSEYESDKLQRLGDNEIKPKKLNFKFFS